MTPVRIRTVGFVGTGIMGAPICEHLLDAGYQLTVFNRTPSKCVPLVDRGAVRAGSPREVGEASDVVFTIENSTIGFMDVLNEPESATTVKTEE